MRTLATLIIFLFSFSLYAAEDLLDDQMGMVSPHGAFTIAQHRNGNWTTKIQYRGSHTADLTLDGDYPWPAIYHISEDERWMLQIQKTGSGENIAMLYRLEPNKQLWRMEQHLDDLAFTFLAHDSGVSRSDLYHTGIEFVSWDLKELTLQFTVHGTNVKESSKGINRELKYKLKDNVITAK